MTEWEQIQQAAEVLRDRLAGGRPVPPLAVVLGSGLGALADELEQPVTLSYEDIPGFPVSTVASHAGYMAAGRLNGQEVLLLSGRTHYYEGYSFRTVTFYVRALREAGVKTLILTNAAGGINPSFVPGDLMLITDHIKLCADSPSRGEAQEIYGPRFFDLSRVYTPELRETAIRCAAELGIPLREGVYAFMGGPQYETPAEVRALHLLGADAVGMSTVPEAIVAAQGGMRVMGLSCITNTAAGITPGAILSHNEVTETAACTAERFACLVREVVRKAEKL